MNDDYLKAMERHIQQQMSRGLSNPQEQLQRYYSTGGYIPTSQPPSPSIIDIKVRDLERRVESFTKRLHQLEIFYAWMVNTYPEKFAEFKAVEDLRKSCEEDGK